MFDIPERLRTVRNPHSFRMVLDFFRLSRLLLRTGLGRKNLPGFQILRSFFPDFRQERIHMTSRRPY